MTIRPLQDALDRLYATDADFPAQRFVEAGAAFVRVLKSQGHALAWDQALERIRAAGPCGADADEARQAFIREESERERDQRIKQMFGKPLPEELAKDFTVGLPKEGTLRTNSADVASFLWHFDFLEERLGEEIRRSKEGTPYRKAAVVWRAHVNAAADQAREGRLRGLLVLSECEKALAGAAPHWESTVGLSRRSATFVAEAKEAASMLVESAKAGIGCGEPPAAVEAVGSWCRGPDVPVPPNYKYGPVDDSQERIAGRLNAAGVARIRDYRSLRPLAEAGLIFVRRAGRAKTIQVWFCDEGQFKAVHGAVPTPKKRKPKQPNKPKKKTSEHEGET